MINYISLFSGIGGFEIGIHQASEKMGIEMECVFSSEIDKYARQIYEKNFGVEPYGDITRINERDIPDHDLLVAGFPCQAFSIAGKRCGFEDTRGTLFFEIARIARVKRPEILLLENVRGLLSHDKGGTFENILKTLDDIGYDVEWQVLNSKNYGVPQNRERVFIIGHLRGSSERQKFPITGESRQIINQINNPTHSNNRVYSDDGISPTLNCMQGGNRQPFIQVQPIAIDNGKLINKEISNCLDANYYKGLNCNQQRTGVMITEHTNHSIMFRHKNMNGRRFKENNECSFTIDSSNSTGILKKEKRFVYDEEAEEWIDELKTMIRRLTPKECERLQGFPDEWTRYGIKDDGIVKISDSQRYKCIGNAVSVPVIEAVIIELFK